MTTFGKRTHGIQVRSGRQTLGRDWPNPVDRMTKERRAALRRSLEIAGRIDRDEPESGSSDKIFIAVCAVVTVVAVLVAIAAPTGISSDATMESERPIGLP